MMAIKNVYDKLLWIFVDIKSKLVSSHLQSRKINLNSLDILYVLQIS